MTTEILIEDLLLVNEAAPFHWFHKWSKWYRVKIRYGSIDTIYNSLIEQQRHCLICHKKQASDIKKCQ